MNRPAPTYYVEKEQWYADAFPNRSPGIMVGSYAPEGGCHWEFRIETVLLGGRNVPQVQVYDDAFTAFRDAQPFFTALADLGDGCTLDEIREVLDNLGYADATKRVRPVNI